MEREFEKLGEQLDNADLGDIMPSFDKNENWNGLQEKLEQKDRKLIVPIWFRYAAAVVVGLLLGGVSVKQWLIDERMSTSIAVEQQPQEVEQTITINKPSQPSVIVATKSLQVKEITVTAKQKKTAPIIQKAELVIEGKKELVAEIKQGQEIVSPKNNQEKLTVKKVEKEIVEETVSPLKRKTIHLLDIDNEDREVVLSDPGSSSSAFEHIMKQVAHTHTMSASNTNQPILLRKMLKK